MPKNEHVLRLVRLLWWLEADAAAGVLWRQPVSGGSCRLVRLWLMLVTVSRDDAARLLVGAVRYAVGGSGLVVGRVCEAAEQLLGALTVAEGDEIAAVLDARLGAGGGLARAERDRWQRLCRQLQDRTLAGAGERVAVIGRDLAVVCACAERQAETLAPAARAELLERVSRCRDRISTEDLRLGLRELDDAAAEPPGQRLR